MQLNPVSLTVPLIVPGKKAPVFNIYLLVCAIILIMIAVGYLCWIQWMIIAAGCAMIPAFFWGMSMGIPHKKAGTLQLDTDRIIITIPGSGPQTFRLHQLETVYFYIDGAYGDTPDYEAATPVFGAERDQQLAQSMGARNGLKNRLEFVADGVQHRHHLLLLSRHMTALNAVLLHWARKNPAVMIDDHSGRSIPNATALFTNIPG